MDKLLEKRLNEMDTEFEACFVNIGLMTAQLNALQSVVLNLLPEILTGSQAKTAHRFFLETSVKELKEAFDSMNGLVENSQTLLQERQNVYLQLRDLARSLEIDPDVIQL